MCESCKQSRLHTVKPFHDFDVDVVDRASCCPGHPRDGVLVDEAHELLYPPVGARVRERPPVHDVKDLV